MTSGKEMEEALGLSVEMKLWRLAEIIAAARRIHSSLTLDSVLNSFLDIATGEVISTGGAVFLPSKDEEALTMEHSQWPDAVDDAERRRCSDLAGEAAKLGELTEEASLGNLGTIVSLPLLDELEASLGVLQIYRQEPTLDASDRLFLTELSHFASLSIRNAQYHEDSLAKAYLDSAIGVARDIQVGTLPREMPRVPGYDVSGMSRPADETSGDSFDLIASGSTGLTMLLADATGHGIGPALSVTQVRSMLRLAIRLGTALDDILKNINDQLCDDLGSNRFVTAFVGQLDAATHQLRYHSAGQAPLILYRAATGESEMLGGTCPPLGIVPMKVVLAPQVIDFEPGDTLALITDGVFEAENVEEQQFDEEPVAQIIRETGHLTCAEVAREILTKVDAHQGEAAQADDITIVLTRRNA
jgi:phosphoserine phosphatase